MSLDAYKDILGWFSEEDAAGYRKLIEPYRNATFVEVGSFAGRSAISIADQVREQGSKLYCVDTWLGSPENLPTGNSHVINLLDLRVQCESNLKACEALDVTYLCQGRSEDWCKVFKAYAWEFDVIFIDGDHSQLAADLKRWLPLLKPNGTIGGHDFKALQAQVKELWPDLEGVQVMGDVFFKRMGENA